MLQNKLWHITHIRHKQNFWVGSTWKTYSMTYIRRFGIESLHKCLWTGSKTSTFCVGNVECRITNSTVSPVRVKVDQPDKILCEYNREEEEKQEQGIWAMVCTASCVSPDQEWMSSVTLSGSSHWISFVWIWLTVLLWKHRQLRGLENILSHVCCWISLTY